MRPQLFPIGRSGPESEPAGSAAAWFVLACADLAYTHRWSRGWEYRRKEIWKCNGTDLPARRLGKSLRIFLVRVSVVPVDIGVTAPRNHIVEIPIKINR